MQCKGAKVKALMLLIRRLGRPTNSLCRSYKVYSTTFKLAYNIQNTYTSRTPIYANPYTALCSLRRPIKISFTGQDKSFPASSNALASSFGLPFGLRELNS